MDFDFETFQYTHPPAMDFMGDHSGKLPEDTYNSLFPGSSFQAPWLGLRGPHSAASRGSMNAFVPSDYAALEAKADFEDFVHRHGKIQQEIVDLNRKNAILESERDRLVTELVNVKVKEIEANSAEFAETSDDTKLAEEVEDLKDTIEELRLQVAESKRRYQKLEQENQNYSERVFDLEMDKERLTIKLHQSYQQCCDLKDSNRELRGEVNDLYHEKQGLLEKVAGLEAKLENIEDGGFEHVDTAEDVPPAPEE